MNKVKDLFKDKSAFDIPELKSNSAEKIIKGATADNKSYSVPPQILGQLASMGSTNLNCAIIITQLLRVFDELGSHPAPVYKSFIIMISLLKSGNSRYIQVCRALIPEITSCLYLSFGEKRVPFRDQIHMMAAAIYDFLMYEVPLPDPSEFAVSNGRQVHRPAPPPQDSDPAPVVFLDDPEPVPPPEPDEDDDIPFDPRGVRQQFIPEPEPEPVYEPPPPPPPPVEEEIIKMPEPEPEPPQSPPPAKVPPPEPEFVIQPKTEQDLHFIKTLSSVTKSTYDDSIEWC